MPDDARSCPSCGARVPPDAAACDLCGTPVDPSPDDAPAEPPEPSSADDPPDDPAPDDPDGQSAPEHVYCNACGWENPGGANFCSRCGSELQDLTGAPGRPDDTEEADAPEAADAPTGTRPVSADLPAAGDPSGEETAVPRDDADPADESAEMGQQILMVVGTAVVLVLGLFFATQWSQQYEWGDDASGEEAAQPAGEERTGPARGGPNPEGGAPPASPRAAAAQAPTALSTLVGELGGTVEGPVADQIDSVRTAAGRAEGRERRQLRAQLVKLYIGAGTPGRAALVQDTLADQTGRVEDRRRAADLLYRWMRQVEQQGDRARIADVAQHVAAAYAAVVEQRPQDLDARTRMGEAYMLTNNPMKGIQAINQVLADDSTFVPARFQKGIALLQINRLDQAVTQFERVMEYASQDDPFYQQAKRAIEVIREQGDSGREGAPAGR
jgi:ribosomal protein L40E/exonuclease VII small subunit